MKASTKKYYMDKLYAQFLPCLNVFVVQWMIDNQALVNEILEGLKEGGKHDDTKKCTIQGGANGNQ